MPTMAIVGGQYGSEGKGVIAAHLARGTTCAVRTGGPNAGHSLNHLGRVWKMRSVPCAWINPGIPLLIGPGAVVDPVTLVDEVAALEDAGFSIRNRLVVDSRATIIIPGDHEEEKAIGLGAISSTLEGVGAARMRRIARQADDWQTVEAALAGTGIIVADTVPMAGTHSIAGLLMLEGTQGFGLSMTHGNWPWVTSHDTTAQQLVADAGIGADTLKEVLVVFRSYPIRVGGPSGPMQGEMSWEELANKARRPDLTANPERTTVTNKIRRVGTFDWDLSARAVLTNGATAQALTFADYLDPEIAGSRSWTRVMGSTPVRQMVDLMEEIHGIPVAFVGTGGPEWSLCVRPDTALHYRGAGIGEIHSGATPS